MNPTHLSEKSSTRRINLVPQKEAFLLFQCSTSLDLDDFHMLKSAKFAVAQANNPIICSALNGPSSKTS